MTVMLDGDIQNLTHAACHMSGIDIWNAAMTVCRTGGTARNRRPDQMLDGDIQNLSYAACRMSGIDN
jgi:hypothetical protein